MKRQPSGPRRKRRCGGKTRYRSYTDASNAAASRETATPDTLFVYECPRCKGHHITREAPSEYAERVAGAWATTAR